jgi:hypothetical protein
MIKKTIARIVAMLVGVAAVVAVAVTPAHAGSNFGRVYNDAGATVWIDCALGGTKKHPKMTKDHLLHERKSGKKWKSNQFKGCSDADAFYLRYDKRCVLATGLAAPGGVMTKADPGHWFKLPGLSLARTKAWGQCKHSPWLSSVLRRLS